MLSLSQMKCRTPQKSQPQPEGPGVLTTWGPVRVREDGATSFPVSYSFEVSFIMKIRENRVTKNCSRFLKVCINKLTLLQKMQYNCVIQKIIIGLLTRYVLIHCALKAVWSSNRNLVSVCTIFSIICISVTLNG